MDKRKLILLIVGVLFVFVLGGGAGVYYKTQEVAERTIKNKLTEESLEILSSKIISTINAYGEVVDIKGRDVFLSYEGDTIKINVDDDAVIYSVVEKINPDPSDITKNASQELVDFSQIKIGDNLNVGIKINENFQFEAQLIMIMY